MKRSSVLRSVIFATAFVLSVGVALAQAGKLDEAIPYLRKALDLTPWDGKTYSNLGTALASRT